MNKTRSKENPPPQMSIGAFAQAARLSPRALRLYERLDLLRPARVDDENGYRFYRRDQLRVARRIRLLRLLEMPLATIRRFLLCNTNDEQARLLGEFWGEREAAMRRGRDVVTYLQNYLLKEPNLMNFPVSVRDIAPTTIVSLNKRVTIEGLETHIHGGVARLREFATQNGFAAIGAPFGIYHGPVNPDEDGPMENCLPVVGDVSALPPADPAQDSNGVIGARTLAGGNAAVVTATGPEETDFPAILGAYDAAFDWIGRNGYEPAEPPREVWVGGEPFVMEIVVPFREKMS